MITLLKLEKRISAMTTFHTITVSARAYAEYDVEQGFDHDRYGHFEEVDTGWRNTDVSVEVLLDAAMVG